MQFLSHTSLETFKIEKWDNLRLWVTFLSLTCNKVAFPQKFGSIFLKTGSFQTDQIFKTSLSQYYVHIDKKLHLIDHFERLVRHICKHPCKKFKSQMFGFRDSNSMWFSLQTISLSLKSNLWKIKRIWLYKNYGGIMK